jgi:hypothetical protein
MRERVGGIGGGLDDIAVERAAIGVGPPVIAVQLAGPGHDGGADRGLAVDAEHDATTNQRADRSLRWHVAIEQRVRLLEIAACKRDPRADLIELGRVRQLRILERLGRGPRRERGVLEGTLSLARDDRGLERRGSRERVQVARRLSCRRASATRASASLGPVCAAALR